jgi:uncharacterized protein
MDAMATTSPALSRRRLLQGSATIAAAQGTLTLLGALATRQALAVGRDDLTPPAEGKQMLPAPSPFGALAPVADVSTGLPLLQLPPGFEYRSFGWSGDPMSDGRPTPSNHDGMAVVDTHRYRQGHGLGLVLVRNHERGLAATVDATILNAPRYDTGLVNGIIRVPYNGGVIRIGASGTVTNPSAPDPTPYVGYAAGGTTNLHYRGDAWRGSEASLGGTIVNCAGGPTPWGSWLTCEETILDLSSIGGKKHGYVFESAAEPRESNAKPLVGLGRFAHEAVAVDPRTGDVYETEDSRNLSAFFRFRPKHPGRLHWGGTLQAARIVHIVRQARPGTLAQANDQGLLNPDIGDEYKLEWVDIADPDADPVVVTDQPGGVSFGFMAGPTYQALSRGCARMSRGEGIWYSAGRMFIVDTAAGLDGSGRPGRGEGAVWELDLRSQRLRCIFASGSDAAANNPDNITVSPRGGLLLCEDGGAGSAGATRLLGLEVDGAAYEFCRNNVLLSADQIGAAGKLVAPGNYLGSEFCGACFDPKGQVLFVSIQSPGITFAIRGPWRKGGL